jgi:hypothetical protein
MSNQFNQQIVLDIQAQGANVVAKATEEVAAFVEKLNKVTDVFRNTKDLNIWIEEVGKLKVGVKEYAKIVDLAAKEAKRASAEIAKAEREQKTEAIRLAKEQAKAERERIAETKRLEREQKTEAIRLAKEQAKAERERIAETKRLERERAKEEREQKAESARLAREQAKAEREQRRESARLAREQAKADREQKSEAARLAREQAKADREQAKAKEEAERKGLEAARESIKEQARLRADADSDMAASYGNVARAESELADAKEEKLQKEKKILDIRKALWEESAKGAAADAEKIKALIEMRTEAVSEYAAVDKKVIALEGNLTLALAKSGVTFKEVAEKVRAYLIAQKEVTESKRAQIDAQDRYNKGAIDDARNLANLEAATDRNTIANRKFEASEVDLAELQERSGAGVKELADSLIKTGQGMEEASTRSQHLSRAIYYSSQAAQDLNYGILAIMNNLPGMTEEFAKAGGANHETAMKWAAGVGLISSAFMALTMWGPQIAKFFKKVDLTTLEGQIESVETKIKVLNAMSYVFHVDKRQLNALEVQLNYLEDKQKLMKSSLAEKTIERMQAEESAKKLLASHGGAQTIKGPNGQDVQITGAENIKRIFSEDKTLLKPEETKKLEQLEKDYETLKELAKTSSLEDKRQIHLQMSNIRSEITGINNERMDRGQKIMSDYLAAEPGSEKTFTEALERNRKPLEATKVNVTQLKGFAGEITSENAKKNRYSGDDFAFEKEEKVKEAIGKFDKEDQDEARKVASEAKEPLEALDDFKKVVAERKSDAKAEAERVANAPMKEREHRIDRAVSNVNREVRKAMDEKAEELEKAVGNGDLDEAGMDTARKKIEEAAKEKITAIVNSVKSISDDIKQDVIDRVVPEAVLQIETDQVSGNAKQRIDKKAEKAKEEAERTETKDENKLKAEAKQIESSMGRRGLDVNTLKAMSEGANKKQLEEYLVPIITKHLKEGLGKTDEKEIADLASRVAEESIKNANDSVSGRGGDVQGALNEAYNKQPLVREAVAQERKAEGVQKKLNAKQQKAYNQANAQFEHHTGQLMQHFGPELNAHVAGMRAQGLGADEIMGQMGNGVAGRVMQAGYTEDQATELARRMLQRSIQQNFMGAAAKGAGGNAADQWMGAMSRSTSTQKNMIRAGNARAIQAQQLKKEQEEAARMARNSVMQQRSMNASNQ